MIERVCETAILRDEATSEDEFGQHSVLASVLADAIASAPSGSVCLVGEWGSGKSSVVKMLQKAMRDENCETVVLVFDAWTHQGDPLRRVFLCSLVDAVFEAKWITPRFLGRIRRLLSGDERTTIAEQSTVLKPLGATVLFVIASCAVLASFLASAARFAQTPGLFGVMFGSSVFLGVFPLVFVGALYVLKRRGSQSRDDDQETPEDVLAAFVSRPPTVVTTRTFDPGQLDTARFERIFRLLVTKSLQPHRRLVIVVDNLDRIPPETAKEVWGTMQVFIGPDLPPSWLIVPIAESAAESLWSTGSEDESPDRDISHSMLTKSFQIRVDVPNLVRSDFGEYFTDRLVEALPAHREQASNVLRTYETYRNSLVWRTPRETKRFLNELVMVHRQWRHETPLATQALYVLARNEKAPLDELVLGERDYAPVLGDPAWRQNVAAMAYGVDASTALQVLLLPKIAAALHEHRIAEVAEFTPVPGFWQALADSVSREMDAAPVTTVEGFLETYWDLLVWPELDASIAAGQVRRTAACALTKCTDWTPSAVSAEVLVALVNGAVDPEASLRGLLALSAKPSSLVVGTTEWAHGMSAVVRALSGRLRAVAEDCLELPGDVDARLALIADFDVDDRVVPRERLVSGLSPDETKAAYSTTLVGSGPSVSERFRAGVLIGARLLDPSDVIDAVFGRLQGRSGVGVAEMPALWGTLSVALLLGGSVEEAGAAAALRGDISYWADIARQIGDSNAEAAILLLALELGRSGQVRAQWPVVGSSGEVFDVLDQAEPDSDTVDNVARTACASRWLLGDADTPDAEFEARVLASTTRVCDPMCLPVRWVVRAAALGGTEDVSIDRIAGALVHRVPLLVSAQYDPGLAGLCESLASLDLSPQSRMSLDDWLVRGLRSAYSEDEWTTALAGDTPTTALLLRYGSTLASGISREFASAVAVLAIAGQSPSPPLKLGDLLASAEASDREVVRAGLLRVLLTPPDDDWHLAGDLLVRTASHLTASGFPWNLPSGSLESLAKGLLSTNRACDVEMLGVLASNPPFLSAMSRAARLRTAKVARGQLRRRGSKRRKQALSEAVSVLTR